MIINGNNRAPDTPKPGSLNNARVLRMQLRKAGYELRLDADEQLVIDPPNAEVLAGAQAWLKRYRVPLLAALELERAIGAASGIKESGDAGC